jgi:peptidoglycan/LPS O-acetylase OafA/YrhL
MSLSKQKYRRDIDGLRAVAILMVTGYHAGLPFFKGGFVGVDIYFVISGFLITQLLQSEQIQTGKISLTHFYVKRIRRLLPAMLVVILFTLLAWAILLPGQYGQRNHLVRSVRWALIGLSNIFFLRNGGGYFDGPTAEMPLLHLWSLSFSPLLWIRRL